MKADGVTPAAVAAAKYTALNQRVRCEGSVYKEPTIYDEIRQDPNDKPEVCKRPAVPLPDYLELTHN